MAKKKAEDGTNLLINSFAEFKQAKNIDLATLVSVLEESLRIAIIKTFKTDTNYDVIINPDKGDFEIYRKRIVVPDGEVEDENMQISLSEARKIEDDYEVGEEVSQQMQLADFGRRTLLALRQTLQSRVLELENDALANEYRDRVGNVVVGEVYQAWKRETLILDEDETELILPRAEQIPSEFFRKGDTLKAVIERVDQTGGKPRIILSRTSPTFLQRLLEAEVPEIGDGLITIRHIARLPGERAKVAVESYDERIDPVGACVGVKGSRVHGIVRELHGENIDVINYIANDEVFIARALAPARINRINLLPANTEDGKPHAEVYLDPDQVSLAIGKMGQNIKLASLLTGYNIDVFRDVDEEDEDDVELDQFANEVDPWVIDALKGIGLMTARAVLNLPREVLVARADLEEETVDAVLRILNAEFAEDNTQAAPKPQEEHEEPEAPSEPDEAPDEVPQTEA